MSKYAETHVVPPLTIRVSGPVRLQLWSPTGPIDALVIPEVQAHTLPAGFDFTPYAASAPPPPQTPEDASAFYRVAQEQGVPIPPGSDTPEYWRNCPAAPWNRKEGS